MEAEAVGDQRRADHQQETQRQHHNRRVASMNRASGWAASRITTTAEMTAITMMPISSVMPTAERKVHTCLICFILLMSPLAPRLD